MTDTKHKTTPTAPHTPEPWDYDTGFIVAPDPAGEHPDIYIAEIAHSDDEGRIAPYKQHEANARRICAAVNACLGITTEALERGVVADLRHILPELVSAAGDLDAAIDGVTDQFHSEQNRLKAILRASQTALDSGMEIDVHQLLASRKQVAAIWSIEDVQQVRPDLTDEQAWEVLYQVGRKHDAEYGISWTTLECMADLLFGTAPKTDSPE